MTTPTLILCMWLWLNIIDHRLQCICIYTSMCAYACVMRWPSPGWPDWSCGMLHKVEAKTFVLYLRLFAKNWRLPLLWHASTFSRIFVFCQCGSMCFHVFSVLVRFDVSGCVGRRFCIYNWGMLGHCWVPIRSMWSAALQLPAAECFWIPCAWLWAVVRGASFGFLDSWKEGCTILCDKSFLCRYMTGQTIYVDGGASLVF